MPKSVSQWLTNPWIVAIIALLLSRFLGMAFFPFADTTEPRYAEIARMMAQTGDWITPWFKPGVPFWGKPPLSFWAQAGAINLFGTSEFAIRLPSWIASVGVLALIWRYAQTLFGTRMAHYSALVLASMALFYISAGAVMTDAFLVLGTTLSLVSFGMVVEGHHRYWCWFFFVGIVIGLLAKGPLAAVLTGIPVALWLLCQRERFGLLRAFPWVGGVALTAALTLPWYIAAEIKTPGFLDYFIIGEHFRRFLDPGWAGDLYGSAHQQPKGMVWMFWVWASFPWGLVVIVGLAYAVIRGRGGAIVRRFKESSGLQFIFLSAIAPMLFFTMAGNTLWTYVLPALPFSAILVARWLVSMPLEGAKTRRALATATVVTPLLSTIFVVVVAFNQDLLKTEESLIGYYNHHLKTDDSTLVYLDDLPFSARYYSRDQAREVTLEKLETMQQSALGQQVFVAVPRKQASDILAALPGATSTRASNRRYQLLALPQSSSLDAG